MLLQVPLVFLRILFELPEMLSLLEVIIVLVLLCCDLLLRMGPFTLVALLYTASFLAL